MRHRPLCAVCDYDLTAVPTDTCPECGSQFEITVHTTAPVRSHIFSRAAACVLVLGAVIFCLAEVSHGSLMFWWSVQAGLLVLLCTPLITFVVFGPPAVTGAIRALFHPSADPTLNHAAASVFRFSAAAALCTGAIASCIGIAGAFGSFADLGALGHSVAIAIVSQLYSLFLFVPCFAAAAVLGRRIDATAPPLAHRTRPSLRLAGAASLAATLTLGASLGLIVWAVQR